MSSVCICVSAFSEGGVINGRPEIRTCQKVTALLFCPPEKEERLSNEPSSTVQHEFEPPFAHESLPPGRRL